MIVTTINGSEIDRKYVRKIKNLNNEFKYYIIGNINIKDSGDCYQLNNIYYTVEKERLAWDNINNQYNLKSKLSYGVIDSYYDQGYFDKKSLDIVTLYLTKDPIPELCISRKVALTLSLIEDNNNMFFNPAYYTYADIIPRNAVSRDYKNSLPYNFKPILLNCKNDFKNYVIDKNSIANMYYDSHHVLLNKYTFGIEIETTIGVIPDELIKYLGVRPLRDGSITGLEYVTIPLTGRSGINAFFDIVNLINKYTSSNFSCAMHVHVGNVPRTPNFIAAMFKVMYYIQDDVYNLFPMYKKHNANIKKQCYTAPLNSHLMSSLNYQCNTDEDIKNDYQKIVQALSGNHRDYRQYVPLQNILQHPYDPSENSKWNMKERYKILNLIPLIFTNKQTIEYRIYTVPDTAEKALSFLMMSLIITEFANRNTNNINANQGVIKDYNLDRIYDCTVDSSTLRSLLYDRREAVNKVVNYKGAFFEEKDIIIHKKRYAKKLDFITIPPQVIARTATFSSSRDEFTIDQVLEL